MTDIGFLSEEGKSFAIAQAREVLDKVEESDLTVKCLILTVDLAEDIELDPSTGMIYFNPSHEGTVVGGNTSVMQGVLNLINRVWSSFIQPEPQGKKH